MSDVYDLYKPLRNYLRKVDLSVSLGPLRWYINYNQLASPPAKPDDIEIHRDFWTNSLLMAPPWQLAFIVRELLIEGRPGGEKDLRKWNDYGPVIDKVRKLDNEISGRVLSQGNAYHYVSKVLPHVQFVWQENRPNHQANTRYYSLFKDEPLRSIFEAHFGLSIEKYFAISATLWGTYVTSMGVNYPPTMDFKGTLTNADYDNFIKHYALPLDELRKRLLDPVERKMDETFPLYYDSLKKYPLILMELGGQLGHICPVPTYLYWRTTEGIYYDLIGALKSDPAKYDAFGGALGDAYGTYVGAVLQDQPYNRPVAIIDADAKIKFGDPKPDWFIVDDKSVALIECKAKRLTLAAKHDMSFSPATEDELKKLAKMIIQVYKALIFAQNNRLPYLGTPQTWYPIVVTLENWYILGDMKTQLDQLVNSMAIAAGIPAQTIIDHPYLAIASDEIENVALALRNNSLDKILHDFVTDPQYRGWSLKTYLSQKFKKEISTYELFQKNPLDEGLKGIVARTPSQLKALKKIL